MFRLVLISKETVRRKALHTLFFIYIVIYLVAKNCTLKSSINLGLTTKVEELKRISSPLVYNFSIYEK